MTTIELIAPLDAAIDAALADPAVPDVWLLPAGTFAIAPRQIDIVGRDLTIVGRDTRLVVNGGGFAIRADRVRFEGVRFEIQAGGDGVGVDVDADEAVLSDVGVGPVEGGDITALAVAGSVSVAFAGVSVEEVRGDIVFGVRVRGGEVDVAGLVVHDVQGTAEATGLSVRARGSVELADVVSRQILGTSARGCDVAATRHVTATDLACEQVVASSGLATAARLASGGDIQLRGFTAAIVAGSRAFGVTLFAARGADVAYGRVENVVGSGATAIGLWVDAAPSEAGVSVRDVSFEAIDCDVDPVAREVDVAWTDHAADVRNAVGPVGNLAPPDLPAEDDCVALRVTAVVDGSEAFLATRQAGAVDVRDSDIAFVRGSMVQIGAGIRRTLLRRIVAHTAVFVGWVWSEHLELIQLTVDRTREGLRIGPGHIEVYASIFSGAADGRALDLDADVEDVRERHAYLENAPAPFEALEALPYRVAPPRDIPAGSFIAAILATGSVDLRLDPDHTLAELQVEVPGDPDGPVWVGALEPEAPRRCHLDDPLPAPIERPDPTPPLLAIDYRARDARSLLERMLARADTSMSDWVHRGPADFARMMFETLAYRLDRIAYTQEVAFAEGNLTDARRRRSVEDHVRPLDYAPDPGLSASTVLGIDWAGPEQTVDFPAGMLVMNDASVEQAIVFETEHALAFDRSLEGTTLSEPVAVGATRAVIDRAWPDGLTPRWVVLSNGPSRSSQAFLVTKLEAQNDRTLLEWDPRRPAKVAFERGASVHANVVVAHHGIPIGPAETGMDIDEAFEAVRAMMEIDFDSTEREIELPFGPVSVRAHGLAFPEAAPRAGRAAISVEVDGDEWRLVDELSTYEPEDQVYTLRAGHADRPRLVFGDGENGRRLLAGQHVTVEMRVGLGAMGNVGEGALDRVWFVPVSNEPTLDRPIDELRTNIHVRNLIAASHGREPESTERMRYLAPLLVDEARSAVTPADFERLLLELPEVNGAHATVVDFGYRRAVRVTALLSDVDDLETQHATDELFRRFALARERLEEIRLLGFDVEIRPPQWVPLDLDVTIDAAPHVRATWVEDAVTAAIAGPGGALDPDRTGLGGDVHLSELYSAINGVDGVLSAQVLRFRRLEQNAREYLDDGVIPMSHDEVARVRISSEGEAHQPWRDGLLTVTVCGGMT